MIDYQKFTMILTRQRSFFKRVAAFFERGGKREHLFLEMEGYCKAVNCKNTLCLELSWAAQNHLAQLISNHFILRFSISRFFSSLDFESHFFRTIAIFCKNQFINEFNQNFWLDFIPGFSVLYFSRMIRVLLIYSLFIVY